MAHIVEYKIGFEIEDGKTFEGYGDEWINNNCYARYRVASEEYVREYSTHDKKINIEDQLELYAQIDDMNIYENRFGHVYITDNKNKVRVCIEKDTWKILYARDVSFFNIGRWMEFYTKKNSCYYGKLI